MRRLVVLAVLAILGVVWVPAPAAAHGGKIKLEVAGDGATGITVRALYQSDGHPVEDKELRLTLTATGEGGKTAGPLDLEKSPEGRAFYRTGGVLSPGRWTVVVTGADPNVLRAESTVEARAQATAAPPAVAVSSSADRAGSAESGGGNGNSNGTWWSVAFVAALALTGGVVLLKRRRR